MFPVPSAWTCEAGFPSKVRILGFWDGTFPVISGTCADAACSSLPQHGPGELISPKVRHKHLLFRIWAIWARAWVGVEAKTSRSVLQGPRGMSKLWYRRLSL